MIARVLTSLFFLTLCPALMASSLTLDQLKADIQSAPELRVISGLNLIDRTDGLQRMNFADTEMVCFPGPIEKRFSADQHTLAFLGADNVIIEECTIEASVVEEALKFSDCRNVWVRNCTLIGGREDALDVVRGGNLIFENITFVSRGARAVTIKGGVDNVWFVGCDFSGSATSGAFIELGDWSDYDKEPQPPTRNIFIDANNVFHSPTIQVRRGNARRLRTSVTVRPVRTYYTEHVNCAHYTENVPAFLMPLYFGLQNLIK